METMTEKGFKAGQCSPQNLAMLVVLKGQVECKNNIVELLFQQRKMFLVLLRKINHVVDHTLLCLGMRVLGALIVNNRLMKLITSIAVDLNQPDIDERIKGLGLNFRHRQRGLLRKSIWFGRKDSQRGQRSARN